jgi:hypothetical protein
MGLAAFTHGLPVILFPERFESMSAFWNKLADLNLFFKNKPI